MLAQEEEVLPAFVCSSFLGFVNLVTLQYTYYLLNNLQK